MSYALNSRALNSAPVNGRGVSGIFTPIDGQGEILGLDIAVTASGEGELLALDQIVGIDGQGELLALDISVNLQIQGQGELLALDIAVTAAGEGELLALDQVVYAPLADNDEIDVIINIAGWEVDNGTVVDHINIEKIENQSSLATLTLQPGVGILDFAKWEGQPITIDTLTPNHGLVREFTGTVDVPNIDVLDERIKLPCSNNRYNLNNALPRTAVDDIGYFSEAVFSNVKDQAEELEKRLETIEASFDYDGYLIPRLTDWKPKAVADYVFDDPDIYRRDPQVTLTSKGRVINQVNIEFELQHQRLRHRERRWQFDSKLTPCEYDAWGLPPTVQMLRTAIESAGWQHTDLVTEGLAPAGAYNCYGVTIYYTPRSGSVKVRVKTDDDGKIVTDSDGNPQYETYDRSGSDVTNVYASAADWKAAKRWTQNVILKNQLQISAPQSISQYGLQARDFRWGVTSEYEEANFAELDSYQPPPENFTLSLNGDYVLDANDQDEAAKRWRDMVQVGVRLGKTLIAGSHRDNALVLQVPYQPGMGTHHTVEAVASKMRTKGKVQRVVQNIDCTDKFADTEVTVSMSRARGVGPVNNSIAVNQPIPTDPPANVQPIKLGTHTIPLGEEQDESLTGYILREIAKPNSWMILGAKTPYAMIVDSPDIDDESRETKEVVLEQIEEIPIRNDLLEIEFDGT